MEHEWHDTDRGNLEFSEKNLSHYQYTELPNGTTIIFIITNSQSACPWP